MFIVLLRRIYILGNIIVFLLKMLVIYVFCRRDIVEDKNCSELLWIFFYFN